MRGFRKDKRGVSAIEFAFVAPVLLLLMLGGIEYSLMLFTQNNVQSATRDTARQISINHLTAAEAKDYLCDKLPGWVQDHCSVQVTHSHPNNPTQDVVTVSATVPSGQASVINLLIPKFGEFELTTKAVMKRENLL